MNFTLCVLYEKTERNNILNMYVHCHCKNIYITDKWGWGQF